MNDHVLPGPPRRRHDPQTGTSPERGPVLPADRLRRARTGTAGLFLLTGIVFATWAARIPARKAELGLSDAQLAIAFIGLNAGAIFGLQLGAAVVTRVGSRRALTVSLPVFAGMLIPIAHAPGLVTLTIALAVSATANSVVDVAINDHGVGLQHAYGRPVLSGLHAMHSLGGVAGGALAAGAAQLDIAVGLHFTAVAIIAAILGIHASRRLLPPDTLHAPAPAGDLRPGLLSGWSRRLVLLGALAFVFTLAESSALDWSAVLLRDTHHTTAAVAAIGLAVFQATVTLGRALGDRIINRAGPVRVFRLSAFLAGGGLATGLLVATPWSAVAGLALLGLGLANLLPISIAAAGAGRRIPVPVAVARVSALGYLGSFTGPALIGLLTHATSLPTALLLPAIAIAATTVAATAARDEPALEKP
ncbi:MFS transporter [Kribbella sp. NPDC023855]|uniref:MFS transporter n=1 Tax=Kribbella sp. NPDC023855 TaxID=3154698 RepID=UPI0033E2F75C